MSEMQRYEGPIRAGMTFEGSPLDGSGGRYRTTLMVAVDGWFVCGDGILATEAQLRESGRPVRPADTDTKAWALFLPDGPLPDSGPKVFKVGQVWAATFDGDAAVFTATEARSGYVYGDVLSSRGWHSNGINLASIHQSATVLLFDAPEAAADSEKHNHGVIADAYAKAADALGDRFARAMEQAAASNQSMAPKPRREPVLPWVRVESKWYACTDAYGARTDCKTPAAYLNRRAYGCPGACEAHAERAGVFGPVDTTWDLPLGLPVPVVDEAPGLTATLRRLAGQKAAPKKPCPACNDVPFDTRRCPRCGLASKAEPVRVRLAPISACTGCLATHGTASLRVIRSNDEPQQVSMCEPCYVAHEKNITMHVGYAREAKTFWRKPAQPPARVDTVPQSLGPGAGIGIWASRGMREKAQR